MATINVQKVKPFRHVRVQHFPEAASQTFVRGDLLCLSGATSAYGESIIKATSDSTVTDIVGFAAEGASGTTGTKIAVWAADPEAEFVGNVATSDVTDDALVATDVGGLFGLIADTTNAAWRVDLGEPTTTQKIVKIVQFVDAHGDTNGRVVFRFSKEANVAGVTAF